MKKEEAEGEPGPNEEDLLTDPNFVPCRAESCKKFYLHHAHEVSGRRGSYRKRKRVA